MRPVRTISRKDRGEERPDHVHGKARTSPESSETIRQTPVGTWGRYGPICVATCRGRQKCPAPSNYPILTFPFNKGRDQWRSLMSNKLSPNRPRAQALASKADQGRYKIWLYAGNSEYPALLSRSNLGRPVIMRPVRTISRKDLGAELPSHVHGAARTSLESSETIRQTPVGTWGRYGPICMATCRGLQK